MDSLTQAALGAAVGEALLGRRAGNRAALWGAALGTLPDLDVAASWFLPEAEALVAHRGVTHAICFDLLAAPALGFLLDRLHPQAGAGWKRWGWMAFWTLLTHTLLDCFTNYGTQLFWPFSFYPVAFSTISIVDPLYTVPLLAGVLLALRLDRESPRRRFVNRLGLLLSTGYLALTAVNKLQVDAAFRASLRAQGVRHEQLFTSPTLLNNLLWTATAAAGDTLWTGLYSVLDADRRVRFEPLPQHRRLLAKVWDDRPVRRLRWFTRGLYTVERRPDGLYVNDLHVGWTKGWMTAEMAYIFRFRLLPDPRRPDRIAGFEQQDPALRLDRAALRRFTRRLAGRPPE